MTGQVKIRLADLDRDALAIMDGAQDFASRVSYGELLAKDERFTEAVGKVVTLPGVEVILAVCDDRIVGGLGLLFAPFIWNPERTVGEELFFWTSPTAPFRTGAMLLDDAMRRIRERGAIAAFRALNTSPKGVTRAYERHGLKPVETMFMGAV